MHSHAIASGGKTLVSNNELYIYVHIYNKPCKPHV